VTHALEALKAKNSNAAVATAACGAIGYLAANDGNKVKLGTAGAVEALADIMQNHSDSAVVLSAACEAIYELTDNTTTAEKFISAKVHVSVINAIRQHMDNVDVVQEGCSSLARLSYNCTTEMRKTMGSDGVCEILPKAIRKHINNSGVILQTCYVYRI
jgi:hypothetical protein